MTPFTRRAIILAVLMLGTSMLSVALTPTRSTVAGAAQFNLEALIPHQFGDWQMDERVTHAVIDPRLQATISSIYSQTLSRTYFNSNGRRIMLSLAYSENQSGASRIHRPEICYPAQGFQIIKKWKDVISVDSMMLPIMRITTQLGNRYEPITYWLRVGDTLVQGHIEQTFTRTIQGLAGNVPDGILFRVSEINSNFQDSLDLQDQFIRALLSSMTQADRKILLGPIGSKNSVDLK